MLQNSLMCIQFPVAGSKVNCLAWVVIAIMSGLATAGDDFPKVFNTQAEGQHPPTAKEMVQLIELPGGFSARLFAGEPEVQQPICMDFDDRGRLWVAENYSYSGGPYETKLRDRIIILEDRDGDGQHDRRTVFWDKGFMLTSLAWGFGGVWILNDGTLSFLSDKNGDDVPDGEPIVKLDGWSMECGHNFVSGLMWGPDGWLYGRHGIVDTSYPGVPGTPKEDRVSMNCGIWRYHPVRQEVEVLCNGTTNPWGLDYNQDGQFFMTNNVQGHLWHVIPGARFRRMYGQDFNPHAYELMDMTADHYHWDTKTKWNESRDGVANDLGGGHSHVGGLIYEGENFPDQYRGRIFMCNTHGRRVNVNRLDALGSGYVGKREPDFMIVKNAWFRGVDIKMGPDATLFVADWSDNGECHDHDGVHRTSGRIYRISYGTPSKVVSPAWTKRRTARINLEQASSGKKIFETPKLDFERLSPLELMGVEAMGLNETTLAQIHAESLTRTRGWTLVQAIQLSSQSAERRVRHFQALSQLSATRQPANVLLSLVGVLQKFEPTERWQLAATILGCAENAQTIAGDTNLTLMTWYGMEPVVGNEGALRLLNGNTRLQQFAVRRLAHEMDRTPDVASKTLSFIGRMASSRLVSDESNAAKLLDAFKLGLAGRARVQPPNDWPIIERELRACKNPEVTLAVDSLAVLFGDGAALEDLRKLAANGSGDAVAREQAIANLAQAKDAQSVSILLNLISDRAVGDAAIKALSSFDHPNTAKELLKRFNGFKDGNKDLALDTLTSRGPYAHELIEAMESGRVDARDLKASHVRQLQSFGNKRIDSVLAAKWGVVQATPEARLSAIEKWKKQLTSETLAIANREKGAAIFKTACANCHKLYGEGKTIAPDLTGANRGNLEYLLMNVIDPSSVVPKQFTTSVVALKEGRVITGVVVSQTDTNLVIQTDKEQLTVPRSEIDQMRNTGKSLMPDGILDAMTAEQVRDLFGFMIPRK